MDGANALGCVAGVPPCGDDACDDEADRCAGACVDADGDGEDDAACGGTDCNDDDPTIYSDASEVCDLEGLDEDCDPTTVGNRDIDEDGFVDARCCNGETCGEDCDETRRGTNPTVPEVCDGRDNDCDGMVDEELLQSVYVDADRDLHGDPDESTMACAGEPGTSASMLDCDDGEPYVSSPQAEFVDELDNDCDGAIDEMPQAVTWYPDEDGDGFGDPDGTTTVSETVVPMHSLLPLDCDDRQAGRSPLADELCNAIDDDCDGAADYVLGINDWEDDDGDGHPDAACPSGGTDCDDTDPRTWAGATERCDLRDNDCDGGVDESCADLPIEDGLRKPPPRPSAEDGPDVDILTVALRDVVLNQEGDRWRDIGLDLDDIDSQPPVPVVECVPPNVDAEPRIDGNEGIDNAFGDALYPLLRLVLPELESEARAGQERGIGAILLQVRRWNGTANDPRIEVVLTQSAGGTSADPSSVSFEGDELMMAGEPAPPPAWDGNDHWWARNDAFFMGNETQPIFRDFNAYMADGTLVMRLPDRVDLLFTAGAEAGVRLRLTDAFVLGTLSEDFSTVPTATVAGRWSISDLLDTGNNMGTCVGTPQRDIVENQLDTLADVRSQPGSGGAGVSCDAISLGVTFSGVRGNWAGLGPSRPLPDPCGE